jgi:hypothetical protein
VFSLPRASSLDMSIRFVSFVSCGLNNSESFNEFWHGPSFLFLFCIFPVSTRRYHTRYSEVGDC